MLEHSGLVPVEAAKHAVGWPHFVARLGVAAGGADRGPDPWKAASLLLSALVLLASPASADVLGPVAPRTDCPPGSRSEQVGGGHGSFAACVPNLAREDWACVDGRRIEIVGLVLSRRHVSPEWDGRRGPMPSELREMGTDYTIVEGACEPPVDAPLVEPSAPAAPGRSIGGPLAGGIPMGCQRVRAWVDDESFTCAPPVEATPVTTVVATAPAPSPPAAPSSSCACSAGHARGGLVPFALATIACALRSRRRRSTRPG